MTLKEYIFYLFKTFYRGKTHSVKRESLLGHIEYTFDVTDREMRHAYEDLPICGGSQGLYLPETKEEIDEQIALHWSKIYAYFRKIDTLENYHIESDPVQKELFEEGNHD